MDLEQFLNKQYELYQLEKSIEIQEITEKINNLSPIECEEISLSILSLKIDTIYTTIFGKFTIVLSKINKKDLPSGFRVGDEVSLRYIHNKKELNLIATLTKITVKTIEVNISNLDEGYDDINPPIRLDKRASEVTYKKIFQCISTMKKITQPLINYLFNHIDESVNAPIPYHVNRIYNDSLNLSQINAIENCLGDQPLGLIHGPPGTGKTSTITELILQCIQQNMKILVCAPSNIAVDNILERLNYYKSIVPFGFNCLRLGHPARINNIVHSYCLDEQINKHAGTEIIYDIRKEIDKLNTNACKTKQRSNRKEIYREINQLKKDLKKREKVVVKNIVSTSQVILTTCIGADSSLLKEIDHFDMVVIDECAQGLEIETWIPILLGKRCVLAGDHCQLPPVVKSVDICTNQINALTISLFERIIKYCNNKYNNLVYLLNIQYRMNDLICQWLSKYMYDNKLISDSTVSHRSLNINTNSNTNASIYPVMTLIDTTGCDVLEESTISGSHSNLQEALIVKRYVYLLLSSNVINPNDIGIITPYNGQVNVLRQLFSEINDNDPIDRLLSNIMIRTVDGYQGGEKEVIIMSLVRSNDNNDIGFLSDTRRLNVSVTRTKRHFCLIGNKETCEGNTFLCNLLDYIINYGDYRSAMEYLSDDWISVSLLYDPILLFESESNNQLSNDEIDLSFNKKAKSKESKSNKIIKLPTELTELYYNVLEKLVKNDPIDYNNSLYKYDQIHNKITFSKSLNSIDRKNIHKYCEEHGLYHLSIGDNSNRVIEVSKYPLISNIQLNGNERNVSANINISANIEISDTIVNISKSSIFNHFSDNIDNSSTYYKTEQNKDIVSKNSKTVKKSNINKSDNSKGKSKTKKSDGNISEDLFIQQSIHQNELIEIERQYLIPSTAFPNPEKLLKSKQLHDKIKQSESHRKSKSKK